MISNFVSWLSEYNSPNHLDIIIFGVVWTVIAIEYYLWRINQ